MNSVAQVVSSGKREDAFTNAFVVRDSCDRHPWCLSVVAKTFCGVRRHQKRVVFRQLLLPALELTRLKQEIANTKIAELDLLLCSDIADTPRSRRRTCRR